MNEVFKLQENKSYNLRSGISLASRITHAADFGTDIMIASGPKLWKLRPDKLKHALTLSVFKAKIKT